MSDPAASLQTFMLDDLSRFTREGCFSASASADHRLFYVGRDDVHGILDYLLARVSLSLVGNMFGYDDEALNAHVMAAAENPLVTTIVTLDRSQSGGVHEKTILASDAAAAPVAFNSHFAILESSTGQISHTKGFVLDGRVGFEGSTNWSASGEGTFVTGRAAPGGPKYKAQNNTLMCFTDPDTVARFQAELVAEHLSGRKVVSKRPV